ncbi:MAG: 2-oxo-4-hydroxy-4-carboxy-5-ureidoimidazoline decarboxylase [Phycisphaerales bacterium]|nr:2-oxo-4-hydroxy-4-carboxy-5-ureidoimidazoline decarboxylase [Phycisphaerales bacterium]
MSRSPPTPPADQPLSDGLARFNERDHREAVKALHACCGSEVWAAAVADGRPYATVEDFFRAAQDTWFLLPEGEWLEAFAHHPRIGERKLDSARFAATAAQSAREQSGMDAATDDQRHEFEDLNARYAKRFGHVFLICATGKSAAFMLDQLRSRLVNEAHTELHTAAQEQSRITRIRLERMLAS